MPSSIAKLEASCRQLVKAPFLRVEEAFDHFFSGQDNPLRHLGALGLFFLWVIVASGLYLYIVLDTGVEQVYTSISEISQQQPYFGGILRSLHRYASDAFVLVMFLHLLREFAYDRYSGFRFYSWISGVPLIWLVFISGIGGYWIVWDELAQFSAQASAELLDWLPIFAAPIARNFLQPEAISDRFFTLLVFIHLGVPVLLLAALWAHVHRISQVDYLPSRRLMLGAFLSLLFLAVARPAASAAPANLAAVPQSVQLDWIILAVHPLTDLTSPAAIWGLLTAATLLLFVLPFLSRRPAAAVAVVDPPNCSGCRLCQLDCPYAAITMTPHPGGRPGAEIALVDADLCASCGICAGSCPSSTPFRRQEDLVSGIDMPQLPIRELRRQLEAGVAELSGDVRIVVFVCSHGVTLPTSPDCLTIPLLCIGMLPPSFIDYALRIGADGVVVAAGRRGGCMYRLGDRWLEERLARQREPHLRARISAERLLPLFVSASDVSTACSAISDFKQRLRTLSDSAAIPPQPYSRRTARHA